MADQQTDPADYPIKIGQVTELFLPAKTETNVAAVKIIAGTKLLRHSTVSWGSFQGPQQKIDSIQMYGKPVTTVLPNQTCGICLDNHIPQVGDFVWLIKSPAKPPEKEITWSPHGPY